MKLTKHAWILWTVALAVVVALALLIPFVHTSVYWIGFGCIGAMFALCAFAFVRAFRKDKTLESKLFGWPIFKVGYTATTIQIAVGFVLMALAGICPPWVALLVEIILFAAVFFSLTVKDAAREVIVQFENNIPDNIAAWKVIRARANALAAENDNSELRKLSNEISFADPNPSSMDGEISKQLEIISKNVDTENIRRAFSLLRQRKRLIKEEKHA